MAEYIKKDKVLSLIRKMMPEETSSVLLYQSVEQMNGENTVPVVRCRECKYWKTAEGFNLSKRLKFCTYHIGNKYVRHDDDFCSRGEREER